MRHFILFIAFLIALPAMAILPTETVPYKKQDSEHIKQVFTAWDQEKGEYLYESISALVMNEPQPMSPSGSYQTSYELLQSMDASRIDRLERIAKDELENEKKATRGKRDSYYWEEWLSYVNSSTCSNTRHGSSIGEPHMKTFDGETYDFQNGGDYLLSASDDGRFVVQTQTFRRAPDSKFSLNRGVAAYVNGDVVEFRISESNKTGDVFVNEEMLPAGKGTYKLSQGGVIATNGKKYEVKFPTGERMRIHTVSNRSKGTNDYNENVYQLFQVDLDIPECRSNIFGLLGNNDGVKNDLIMENQDFAYNPDRSTYTEDELYGPGRRTPSVMNNQEKSAEYIAFTFSEAYRLVKDNSLFIEQMTDIEDSIRYPYNGGNSLAELDDDVVQQGLEKARKAGVAEDDLYGAVFDYGYLGIDPAESVREDDYKRPERTAKYQEPKLNATGDGIQTDQKEVNKTTPNTNVYIGRTIYRNPYYYRNPYRTPTYRNPSPTRPNGNVNTNPRRPTGSNAGSNGRRPSSTGSSSGGRRTPSGGTRTPGGGGRN